MTELATRHDVAIIKNDLDVLRREPEGAMDRLALRMTARLGGMVAAAVVVLATLQRIS
ncbi:MAG TPA: hypothetical protein VHG92_07110 [Afifellaceae bacterium]|nr:hypothetical protein [Afifellaceae bacterium]